MPESNTSVLNIYDAIQDYNFTSQDYFVHMLRFQQMGEMLGGRYVLDIGCGKHTNLLKAACMMNHGPQFLHYIGIDYGDIKPWRQDNNLIRQLTTLIPRMDMCIPEIIPVLCNVIREKFGDNPYTITCFEVLEHMDFESQLVFMYHLSELMAKTNVEVCFFSTPNYNGSAAKNHICETHASLLEEIITKVGIQVVYKQGLSAWKKFHKLPSSHDTPEVQDLIRCIQQLPTPLQKMVWGSILEPEQSNNILWTLKPGNKGATVVSFDDLSDKRAARQL